MEILRPTRKEITPSMLLEANRSSGIEMAVIGMTSAGVGYLIGSFFKV